MVYKWKSVSGIKADPNLAAAQFKTLENTVGLTPKTLLEANRDAGAVLHDEFEWNDDVAAEKYRVHQAGQIIRMLCVVPEIEGSEAVPIRAYFPTSENKTYERIDVIVKDEDKYAELLASAYSELNAFTKKYQMLKELTSVFDAIYSLELPEFDGDWR